MFHSSSALFLFLSALLTTANADTAMADTECVKGAIVPEGQDYSDWPELFRLTTPNPEDPTMANMDETAGFVDPSVLLAAGVGFTLLDPTGFTYPDKVKEIPWSPPVNGTNDATLQELRDENDYQYADIVVVTAYNAGYYEEHIHAGGDEVRYVIDGSGYFDIRDVNDEWVRMKAATGAFISFPSGIEHRFAVDESLYIQAMRLFPGSGAPDWSSVPRSEIHGNNTARDAYVDTFMCGIDPDVHHDHGESHGSDDTSGANGRGLFVAGALAMVASSLALLA
mmetsp:Transcript_26020/g.38540  ORF Transcript_26020/g.38540 Transcript_26020/m.38540 type:complete len:281 (-) Transcript_26020:67-909(-)